MILNKLTEGQWVGKLQSIFSIYCRDWQSTSKRLHYVKKHIIEEKVYYYATVIIETKENQKLGGGV